HAVAKACARMTVTNGSFELATTTLGNGSPTSGIGANPVGPNGKLAASGSLGATRSAPRTLPPEQPTAQCATSAHPALCATSKISGPVRSSAWSEPRYPIGTVRRFPVILDNTFHGLIPGFPAALPMAGIGVIKAWKNERARHAAAPHAAETSNVPSTISTKLRSSRRMKRLASAAAKLVRASGSAFSFFLYASYDARL